MREVIRDKGRLEHILQCCNNLLNNKDRYVFEEIKDDPIIFYGFVKQVEIIGEATYMLTKEFRADHPILPWEKIEGMRHVLVHGYYAIKPIQLWNVIENDIPVLKPQIEHLLETADFPDE
jgi:uncharacterized protein with HEPN domain